MELTPEAIREIVETHVAVENQGDLEGTIATLSEDCIFESIPRGTTFHGHEGARQMYQATFRAFPDWHVELTNFTPGPDYAWCDAIATATHLGEFDGIPPSGKRISFRMAVKFLIRNGKLGGEILYFDRLTILEQIGAAPEPQAR